MEETLREAPAADTWRDALAQTIDAQRRKIGQRIANHRDRLKELENRIAGQIDEVSQSVAANEEQAREGARKLEVKSAGLDERQTLLDERQKQLDSQRAQLDKLQAELATSTAESAERLKEHKRREEELAAQKQALERERQSVTALQESLRQLESNLQLKQQTLADGEQHAQRQRRTIAQQLRARKNELAAEAELVRSQAATAGAGQDLELQLRLSELQGKYERLKEDYESRQSQRDETTQRLAKLESQLESQTREAQSKQASLAQALEQKASIDHERQKLQSEVTRLLEQGKQQAEAARQDSERRSSEAQAQSAENARLASELERVRHESREEVHKLNSEHSQSQSGQVQVLERKLDEAQKALQTERMKSEHEHKALEQQLAAAKQNAGASGAQTAEIAALREENKQLETWLAEAEEKARQAGSAAGDEETDDLKRRFEMAVQDVRELKTKNAELTEQLTKAKQSAGSVPAAIGGGGSDWESLKQKLLADLETDFDGADETQKHDKLTVQGAIKITDQVVAEKDRELEELRQLLDSQAQQVGEVAVGAAAVAQMFDSDELILQERESLKQLQDGLREQLRQAELDISIERAKLARERAELEEKVRYIESEKAHLPAGADAHGDKGKKAGGRKWLTRLGLGDAKEE